MSILHKTVDVIIAVDGECHAIFRSSFLLVPSECPKLSEMNNLCVAFSWKTTAKTKRDGLFAQWKIKYINKPWC